MTIPFFYSDEPADGKESTDLLNRELYAKKIAQSVKLSPPASGLMVSIEGPWGYGKTSLINFMKKYYSGLKKEKPVIVNFNPWLVGNAENLVQEFLVQFASSIELSSTGKKLKDIGKELIAYSKVFDIVKFIPGAEPYASVVKEAFESIGDASRSIGGLKELNYDKRRISVIKKLEKLNRPIVVFLDDLDRLLPKECYQMLRAIKAVADFPNTTYILAFDPNYLEDALKSCNISEAKKFLDKIIQVRLPLPKINESDLFSIFDSELEKLLVEKKFMTIFQKEREEFSHIYHLYIKPIIKSLREMKRILNRFKLVVNLVYEEVTFTDIFALQVLAIKAPNVYEHICNFPEKYTGNFIGSDNLLSDSPKEVVKKSENERQAVLDGVDSAEREYVEKILASLFPLIKKGYTFGYTHYKKYKKVAAVDRLLVAISYGLPSGEVPDSFIEIYAQQPGNRDFIIGEIIKTNKLKRFLELLLDRIDAVYPPDPENFLYDLSKLGDIKEVKELHKISSFFSSPLLYLVLISKKILKRFARDQRGKVLGHLIEKCPHLTLPTDILKSGYSEHGLYSEGDMVPEEIRMYTAEQLDNLKAIWIKAIERLFKNKFLFDLTDPASIVYLLRRLDKKKIQKLINPFLKNDSDMDSLFSLLQNGGLSDNDAFVDIKPEFLEDIGGEKIKKRVEERLKSNIENTALKLVYQSITTGKSYYLCDGTERQRY